MTTTQHMQITPAADQFTITKEADAIHDCDPRSDRCSCGTVTVYLVAVIEPGPDYPLRRFRWSEYATKALRFDTREAALEVTR